MRAANGQTVTGEPANQRSDQDDHIDRTTDRLPPDQEHASPGYLLDNAAPETGGRFSGLEECYDETTFAHLSALGIQAGWRCWEIGAGGGSVVRWMAAQVGRAGTVIGTDINLQWIGTNQPRQVELRHHDITTDDIPSSAYELIHARLVLIHLPQRDDIINRLVQALVPEGWLVLEEFDPILPPCPDPTTEEQRAFNRVQDAFGELLTRHGADTRTYPRTLPWRLQRAGLVQTHAEGRLRFATGGSPGAAIIRANLLQTGNQAVEAGLVHASDLTTAMRLLDDSRFTFALPLMVSARGRRQQSDQHN